ncbi:hypothetical protein F4861DRAFT_373261 [Xylaria intraflava]|nr:hypothetical protein F4861DRAFT_373261 [Xylaria intraflava]
MPPALVLLRLVPVLTTTSSLTMTFCEDLFLRPNTEHNQAGRNHVNRVLPSYIARFFPRGFAYILIIYPASWASAIANLAVRTPSMHPYAHDPSSPNLAAARAAWGLYAAGLVFSLAHFAWGPKARDLMNSIARSQPSTDPDPDPDPNAKGGGENAAADQIPTLEAWLKLNTVRGLLVDVPAWACFLVGFLISVGYS